MTDIPESSEKQGAPKAETPYEKVIADNGQIVFSPGGTSMLPLLKSHKNPVVLLPVGNKRLKKYDVALFRRPDGQYVLHRVVKVLKDSYVFCGDNQVSLERNITDGMIIAVMDGYYKGATYIDTGKNLRYKLYSRFRVASIPFRRLKTRLAVFVGRRKG